MKSLIIRSSYKANQVMKNPNDSLWYVIGHTGDNHWIPLSYGFKKESEAVRWNKLQAGADKAHRASILRCKFNKASAHE